MKLSMFLLALVSLGIVGCGTVAEPPMGGLPEYSVPVDTIGAKGYVHTFDHSRFPVGTNVGIVSEAGLDKHIGDDGTFAVNPITGAARGVLNASSPVALKPALTSNPDEHNTRVLDYFLSGGLPADQIGVVHAYAEMGASGAAGDTPTPKFKSYLTVISRVVEGIPVPDSFAAARLNVDGEAYMEWVYWPPIPASAIAQARAIAGNGPALNGPGHVAIHHSDYTEANFIAFGALDVQHDDDRGVTHHLDLNGLEIQHPTAARLAASAPAQVQR